MNRDQYVDALSFCYRAEAAGAAMAEAGILLRSDPVEKRKIDLFRRIETTNMLLCGQALSAEGVVPPPIEPPFYRGGIELGLKIGEGDWQTFLDNFGATVHPELFTRYVPDDEAANDADAYESVDYTLLHHLVAHELASEEFVNLERAGKGGEATRALEAVLERPILERLNQAEEVPSVIARGVVG